VLACGESAVLSHVSAAVHWGLLSYEAPRPEVTAPASRRGVPGIRLHRTRSLDAREITTHDGIPITTIARTLLDLAASSPTNHLEHAIGQAMRNQLYDHSAIEQVLDGRRGTTSAASGRRRLTPPSPAVSWSAASAPSAAVPACPGPTAT
jgi:predicted transcriptional regulator of viral defense system